MIPIGTAYLDPEFQPVPWFGEASYDIVFSWPFGWISMALLIAVLLCLATVGYSVRGKTSRAMLPLIGGQWWKKGWWIVWSCRIATFLLLLVVLTGLRLRRFETQASRLLVIVDESASMQQAVGNWSSEGSKQDTMNRLLLGEISDADPIEKTAMASLQGALASQDVPTAETVLDAESLLGKWREEYDLSIVSVGGNGQVPFTAEGLASPVGDVVRRQLRRGRSMQAAAIVLLSDGVVTQGDALETLVQSIPDDVPPLVSVAIGNDRPPPDLALGKLIADRRVLVGDEVEIQTLVGGVGVDTADVILQDLQSGEILQRKTISFGSNQLDSSTEVTLAFLVNQPGGRKLRVRVEKPRIKLSSGSTIDVTESDLTNNVEELAIEVDDEPLKVLVVQDGPSYEFRFLNHLLQRSRMTGTTGKQLFDYQCVLQHGDERYEQQDPSIVRLPPIDRTTLSQFDAVVLSDASLSLLGPAFLKNLTLSVREDGVGLVLVSGLVNLEQSLDFNPLPDLLPVESAVGWGGSLSPGEKVNLSLRKQLHPTLLAPTSAALRKSALGNGEVESNGATMPRLIDLPPVFFVAPVGRLRPTARVLVEAESKEGKRVPAVITHRIGKGTVWMQLTDESFRMQAIDGSVETYQRYWIGLLRSLARSKRAPQENEVVDAAEGQDRLERPPIVSQEIPQELLQTPAALAPLRRLAQASGGSFFHLQSLDDADSMRAKIENALPEAEYERLAPTEELPLWNHPFLAALLAGLLASEWIMRRKLRMI